MNIQDQKSDTQQSYGEGWVEQRKQQAISQAVFMKDPPFPRQLLVEVANICNHSCVFCAYSKMTRKSGFIDPDRYRQLASEAYSLGAREVGLYSGAEPLTCKFLDQLIAISRELGYEYIYVTTNGSLADEDRLKKLIDAGLSSLKFSINAGHADVYEKVHGKDHFDIVLRNIRFVAEYRKTLNRPFFLGASSVEIDLNRDSLPHLKELIGHLVDDHYITPAYNQAGQMDDQPAATYVGAPCFVPFSRAHISREGYLRVCCNDYQNFLAVEDLNVMTLTEAWNSPRFQEFRQRHLDDRVEGTLCHNCLRGCRDKIAPLNPALSDLEQI